MRLAFDRWLGEGTRAEVIPIFVCAFVWLALLAGLRPLNLPDEGRYVGVAWEMAASGQWLTPTLDGLPFFHKPPLMYWLSAASLRTFGPSVFTARLPFVLAAAFTISLAFAVMKEWYGRRIARRTALVLATLPLFYAGAQFANMDLLVAACITSTVLLAARASLRWQQSRPWRGAISGAATAAALGLLAKGLIGVVLPALVLLAWIAVRGRWRALAPLLWPPAVLLFLAIVLPWPLAMQARHPDFLHYFIVVQHVRRFTGSGFNNVAPFWFYVPVLAGVSLPWFAWLFARRRGDRRPFTRPTAPTTLLLVWLIVILAFFSLPQSKLIGYVIPCTIPLAALIAVTAESRVIETRGSTRIWGLTAVAAALACMALVVGVTLSEPASSRRIAQALRTHRTDNDPIAFVGGYWYDLPFYLRVHGPIPVFAAWQDPSLAQSDDWRNELADAGRFDPVAAQSRLIDLGELHTRLCAGGVHWLVIDRADRANVPFLRNIATIAEDRVGVLLRTDVADSRVADRLACPGPVSGS